MSRWFGVYSITKGQSGSFRIIILNYGTKHVQLILLIAMSSVSSPHIPILPLRERREMSWKSNNYICNKCIFPSLPPGVLLWASFRCNGKLAAENSTVVLEKLSKRYTSHHIVVWFQEVEIPHKIMQKVESKIVNRQLVELIMSDGIRTSEMASVPLSMGNDETSRVSAPASRACLLMCLTMCISQM